MKDTVAVVGFITCGLISAAAGPAKTSGKKISAVAMGSVMPTYWWPTDACWDALENAATSSGLAPSSMTVVLNVNNGYTTNESVVTSSIWALWKGRAQKLSDAGYNTLCYVNLCSQVVDFACSSAAHQGNRDFAEVRSEIDKYIAELGSLCHGLFMDDAGHSGSMTEPVLNVTQYAKGLGLKTVHNPGAPSQDPTLVDAADMVIMREGATPGSSVHGIDIEKAVMVLHSVPEASWSSYLTSAQELGYKYFYATNGTWSGCPAYLPSLLTAIAQTRRDLGSLRR